MMKEINVIMRLMKKNFIWKKMEKYIIHAPIILKIVLNAKIRINAYCAKIVIIFQEKIIYVILYQVSLMKNAK